MPESAVDRLPVTLVTGFLGSGKTTLLNHLLTNERNLRVGALVNEFGAVDIDSSLLVSQAAIADGVVQLANGCICCTINDSLCDSITELLKHRASIDYLLLETTGLADPEPVMATLKLPRFATQLRLDGVVVVVDGFSLVQRLGSPAQAAPADAPASAPVAKDADAGGAISATAAAAAEETTTAAAAAEETMCFKQQLANADLLLLNKTDLLRPAQLRAAKSALALRAPAARLLQSAHGRVAPELILVQQPCVAARGRGAGDDGDDGEASRVTKRTAPFETVGKGGHGSNHLEADGFDSVAYSGRRALRLVHFEAARASGAWAGVVRAKGFVRFVECEGYSLTLQQCGPRLDVTAQRWEGDEWHGRFVMIGQALQQSALLSLLAAAEAKGAEGDGAADDASGGEGGADGDISDEWCNACDDDDDDGGGEGGEGPTDAAATFAARVRTDTRLDLVWARGSLVAFRLPPLLGATADQLNSELLQTVNTAGSGRCWLGPSRPGGGELILLAPIISARAARDCWAEVQAGTEQVMLQHFEGAFCGGCSCLENLAGQVLV